MGSEWPESTLEELSSSVSYGYTESASPDKIGPHFLRITDIQNGVVDWNSVPYCPISEKDHLKYKLNEGDIVVARTGNSTGENYIFEGNHDAVFASYLIRFCINDSLAHPKFVWYSMRSQNWWAFVNGSKTGSAQAGANAKVLGRFPLNLPPLPEQKAIAHILGTLDDKIELNRRMNATLEGMAQALFKSWFVDFDPVIDNALAAGNPIPDELAPRAEIRKNALANGTTQPGSVDHPTLSDPKSLFPAAFQFTEELGWIPEGWDVVRFDELVSAKQGRYLAKTDMVETADSEFKYPVWGGNGILGFSSSYAYDEPITLMTCRGSNCGLIKFTESSAWISNNSFACPTNYGSQYFLYLYFLNENFDECVSGSAQPQITYTALKNKIMKFPISEPICELFSNLVQSYKDRQAQNGIQNEKLSKLRDTLLPKLISGELRISEAEQLTA